MDAQANNSQKRVAVVIGSGGVKCAAALGLWKVLQREGIEVSVAVGCSGGSIYAACMALDLGVEVAQELTLNLWTPELMHGYTDNLRAAQSGAARFNERSGLVNDEAMMGALSAPFGDRTFSETTTPLHLVATDFYNGQKVVLSEGRILDAVRASISVPTVFAPVQIGEHLLTDGAACDPLPVDVAIREGGQVIIAVGFEVDYRSRMNSLMAVNTQMNSIYMNNLLRASFAFHNLAHHQEIIFLLPEFDHYIATFSTIDLPYIIEQGERSAEEQMPYLRRLLANSTA